MGKFCRIKKGLEKDLEDVLPLGLHLYGVERDLHRFLSEPSRTTEHIGDCPEAAFLRTEARSRGRNRRVVAQGKNRRLRRIRDERIRFCF